MSVIDLINYNMSRRGKPMFLLCPKCGQDSVLHPIVMNKNDETIFVSSIICVGPKCENDEDRVVFNIENGQIISIDNFGKLN